MNKQPVHLTQRPQPSQLFFSAENIFQVVSDANKTVVLILTFIIIRSGVIGRLNFEKKNFSDSHLESH